MQQCVYVCLCVKTTIDMGMSQSDVARQKINKMRSLEKFPWCGKILAFSDSFLMVFPLAVVRIGMALVVACTEFLTLSFPGLHIHSIYQTTVCFILGGCSIFIFRWQNHVSGILEPTDIVGCELHLITAESFFLSIWMRHTRKSKFLKSLDKLPQIKAEY